MRILFVLKQTMFHINNDTVWIPEFTWRGQLWIKKTEKSSCYLISASLFALWYYGNHSIFVSFSTVYKNAEQRRNRAQMLKKEYYCLRRQYNFNNFNYWKNWKKSENRQSKATRRQPRLPRQWKEWKVSSQMRYMSGVIKN